MPTIVTQTPRLRKFSPLIQAFPIITAAESNLASKLEGCQGSTQEGSIVIGPNKPHIELTPQQEGDVPSSHVPKWRHRIFVNSPNDSR